MVMMMMMTICFTSCGLLSQRAKQHEQPVTWLHWDLVLDLIGEGMSNEALLYNMVTDSVAMCDHVDTAAATDAATHATAVATAADAATGGKSDCSEGNNGFLGQQTLSLDAFDVLVDALVGLYDTVGSEGKVSVHTVDDQAPDVPSLDVTDRGEVEIDPQVFFELMSVVGDDNIPRVPLAALTDGKWDLAKITFGTGLLTPSQMLDWAYATGASDRGLNQQAFDELVDRIGEVLDEFFEELDSSPAAS